MNYAELTAAITAETENNDATFVANIPLMVQNAEKRIYQTVKIPALRKTFTGTTTIGDRYLALPADYLASWELSTVDADGIYTFLLPKDVSFIREAYPNPATAANPRYYAQFDDTKLLLGPTPDATYPVEIHYFHYPETIVTAVTSWIGNNWDNVLLYGALVEAAVFMKSEEDIMKAYSGQYLANLKLLVEYSNGILRSGTYRS
jgi:hypothetical protein